MELTSHFKGLLTNIEPDSGAVTKAKKSHEDLRDVLQADEEIAKADPDTYLSGSYARDTALNRIKDVDIILLLDINHSATEPAVLLAWLQACIQRHYSKVTAQGRSINVTTPAGFDLDVVPASPVSSRAGAVWIPDRDAKEWVATHPKGQIDFSVKKSSATNGFYKPMVKIVKHWRDRLPSEAARAKSYLVESLVAEALSSSPSSYGHAVADVFRSINTRYSIYLSIGSVPQIADPGYPSVNVAKRWKFEEFRAFMQSVNSAAGTAASALKENDKAASVKAWRLLFGDKFEAKG